MCGMITKWIQFSVTPDSSAAFRTELASAYQSHDDCQVFTVLESWETEAAFEAHRKAPHVADFKVKCEAMIVEKSALSLDELAAG
jgi:quinol monooxygenase YgiN